MFQTTNQVFIYWISGNEPYLGLANYCNLSSCISWNDQWLTNENGGVT